MGEIIIESEIINHPINKIQGNGKINDKIKNECQRRSLRW